MTEALGPTPEWMQKHAQQYEPPAKDRTTDRAAYRRVSIFETLHNRGEIEYCHLRAAERLTQHVEGSMGYDVRIMNPWETAGSGTADEFPRTRHAKAVEDAKDQITTQEWKALHTLIFGLGTVESVGRAVCKANKREICRARGLGLVSGGLERLAYHWDFISKKERV